MLETQNAPALAARGVPKTVQLGGSNCSEHKVTPLSNQDYFLVELRCVSNHLRSLTGDVDAIGLAVKQGRMSLPDALEQLREMGCLHLLCWAGVRF